MFVTASHKKKGEKMRVQSTSCHHCQSEMEQMNASDDSGWNADGTLHNWGKER